MKKKQEAQKSEVASNAQKSEVASDAQKSEVASDAQKSEVASNAQKSEVASDAQYRIRNWREYNAELVRRGSLEVWIDEEVLTKCQAEGEKGERLPRAKRVSRERFL